MFYNNCLFVLRNDKFYENTGFQDIQKGDEYEEVENKFSKLAVALNMREDTKVT